MKINWGTAIVIAFALFIAFILFFVVRVQGNPKYDNEMVVEEYYKKDAKYSEEMDKRQNAAQLAAAPSIASVEAGILVTFPKEIAARGVNGELSLYRPSEKKLDFVLPLLLSEGSMVIPKSDLAPGRWNATLSWKLEGKEYMIKQELYIY